MSESQADALKRLAVERGILPPDEPLAPEDGAGAIARLTDPAVPKILLPGDGCLLSHFAREAGRILGNNTGGQALMYRRENVPLMVNARKRLLEPVSADAFRSLVEQRLLCCKQSRHRESIFTVVQTMGKEDARGCLAAPEFLEALPEVERVNTVRLPVLRAPGPAVDGGAPLGRIELLPEGYDGATRTFTFASGIEYDEAMSLDSAVDVLTSLTSEFPFGDWPAAAAAEGGKLAGPVAPSRSQAVVIAGMLTMFAGGLLHELSRKPAFIYSSNSVGSGKTLLGHLAVIPVMGESAVTSWPSREEELAKKIDSGLINRSLYFLFDNIRGLIRSSALEALATSSRVKVRILGSSSEVLLPNLATVFLTGNQATVNEDMDRRSLFVELFVEETDVQARRVSREIDEAWLARVENRRLILSAMWAVVRHWDAAGRPENARRFANFMEWTRVIGGMVQFAGLGDCAARVVMTAGGNREMDDMRSLLAELAKVELVGGEDFEFGSIVKVAVEHGLFDWIVDDVDLVPKQKSMMGKLLKRFEGRTFVLEDGSTWKFGNRGKKRTRRYTLKRVG